MSKQARPQPGDHGRSLEFKLGREYAKMVEKTQQLQHVKPLDRSDLMLATLMQEAVLRISQLKINTFEQNQEFI